MIQTTQDRYPSRVGGQTQWLPRVDPVVWGKEQNGPLSADQLGFYEQNGYLFLPQFFAGAPLHRLVAELERIGRKAAESDAPEVIREKDSDQVRSVFAVHQSSPVFAELVRDPTLIAAARQILDGAVYIHQSRINFKYGFEGEGFYWHSDFETWHVEDGMPAMRAFSCSIALSDNTIYNGSLMVIPGSHRQFISCPGHTPEDHYKRSLKQQEYGTPDQATLTQLVAEGGLAMPTGPAGSVLFFDCNLMHGSGGNITPLPRHNLFFVYNAVENALVEPFSGQKPRPQYIATRAQEAQPLG